jgi:hypothetical protein
MLKNNIWSLFASGSQKSFLKITVNYCLGMEACWKSDSQISTQREREDKRTPSESDLSQNGPEQVIDVLPHYEDETGSVVGGEYEEAECKEESVNMGASYMQGSQGGQDYSRCRIHFPHHRD